MGSPFNEMARQALLDSENNLFLKIIKMDRFLSIRKVFFMD